MPRAPGAPRVSRVDRRIEKIHQDRRARAAYPGRHTRRELVRHPPNEDRPVSRIESVLGDDLLARAGRRVELHPVACSVKTEPEILGRRESGGHDVVATEKTRDLGRVDIERLAASAPLQAERVLGERIGGEPRLRPPRLVAMAGERAPVASPGGEQQNRPCDSRRERSSAGRTLTLAARDRVGVDPPHVSSLDGVQHARRSQPTHLTL